MPFAGEQQKQAVIEAAARLSSARGALAQRFLRRFYEHVPPEDVLARDPRDLCAAALSLWGFAQIRRPGHAKVRVIDRHGEAAGRQAKRAVVEIVNDDMPFLVDSVTAALNGEGLIVDLIIHPILDVARDGEGRLTALLDPGGDGSGLRESFMQVEIGGEPDPARLAELPPLLQRVLGDVRVVVEDRPRLRDALLHLCQDLSRRPLPVPAAEREEALSFLAWLAEDNFTFLGYREYRFGAADAQGGTGLDIIPQSGLGLLRDEAFTVFDGLRSFATLPPEVREFLRQPRLLMITKANRRSTVHRPVPMDVISIKAFDAEGRPVGERIFLGLLTSHAYSTNAHAIPLLHRKVDRCIARAGFDPASHDGKALLHILDTFPRDELFQIGEDELFDMALGILHLQERQRTALFVRRDPFGRSLSCLVYVPRERYDSELRRRLLAILEESLGGKVIEAATEIGGSALARLYIVLRTTPGAAALDIAAVEKRLAEAARSWAERLGEALIERHGETAGRALARRYDKAFPGEYRERFSARAALGDIELIESVRSGLPLALMLYRGEDEAEALHLKIYRAGAPVALSDILPMLEHMGLRVIAEIPYRITPGEGEAVWMQDFSLLAPGGAVDVARERRRFEEAFAQIWAGALESDGLNRLILAAGLSWRQVAMLRLYAKVLRQAGSPHSQPYMAETLARHPAIAAKLVALFERRFDPAQALSARDATAALAAEIEHDLDGVAGLDEDRILRGFLLLIGKSLRTNYFQRDAAGRPKAYLAVKLASSEIDLLPLPRPLYEIHVDSPRLEAVHMRGGKLARGGIRWSDRKEDFRTEILGLMKAQMVKNAVIVPTGAKGGFIVKGQADAIETYKTFMRGLLDLTDNVVGSAVVPPPEVVRWDGDDPYLVVAADKGTAGFSDIANAVAAEYGFWLGDAFASGGSAGYDHKAMGITARGAWEAVKRHFRERGIDIETTDFTVAGVGDMSGDVFGNGMLRSPHIRLIGAFDHRHIFLDPDPDPAASFAERRRLFDLPRSSWADYDRALISRGGGVFARGAKSIPISPEMRTRLGVAADSMTPAELIRALLKAPVDLLWFGGIGTYVKAAQESHAAVGDRANDALRVDAEDIRASVVGEGANLAVTQLGRVAYALAGGRINTDAIDNAAGVDTSDHEVSIKIPLNALVAAGGLTRDERNALLHAMTDEVAALVLRDIDLQCLALTLAEAQGAERFDQQIRLMQELERAGQLDRAVEFLPDDKALATRQSFTRPELAVLMAYVKNTLTDELAPSDLPDDPFLSRDFRGYFPQLLVDRFPQAVATHRLRRDIIATVMANDLVDRGGIAFVAEMRERTGRSAADVARAYAMTREVFAIDTLWRQVNALDNRVPAAVQTEMLVAASRLIERATLWFLRNEGRDIAAVIAAYRPGVVTLAAHLAEILPASPWQEAEKRAADLAARGVPEALAAGVAALDVLASAVDIVRLGVGTTLDVVEVGRRYFAIGARFYLGALRRLARELRADTMWQKRAVTGLIEDLYGQQAELAAKANADNGDFPRWLDSHGQALAGLGRLMREIEATATPDLAMLIVANGALKGFLAR